MQILNFGFCFCLPFCLNGFLLDGARFGNGTGTATNSQFLTMEKFLEYENHQRHLSEQTWTLLTSQLDEKFKYLENKIATGNNSCKDMEIRLKHDELKQRYSELENTVSDLQQKLLQTGKENERLKLELASVFNNSLQNRDKILKLHESDHLRANFNLSKVNDVLTTVKMETMNLLQNQIARSNDFIALHNDTINMSTQLKNLERDSKFNHYFVLSKLFLYNFL